MESTTPAAQAGQKRGRPLPGSGGVLVVGAVNTDRIYRLARLPTLGETVLTTQPARRTFGGKGANQAAAAGRFGAQTYLVAALGGDPEGDEAAANLADFGVDIGFVVRITAPTGSAIILLTDVGDNAIVVDAGANGLLAAHDVVAAIRSARPQVVLVSAEIPEAAIEAAVTTGTQVIYNIAPARPLSDAVIAAGPILVVNAAEAHQLSDAADSETAAAVLNKRTHAPVVVTLGERGALLADMQVRQFAAPRVPVVDTTGAGDAFCGVLAARLAQWSDLPAAVADAVLAGAFAVGQPGARVVLPTPADIARLRPRSSGHETVG